MHPENPPDPTLVDVAIVRWLSQLTHQGIFATDGSLRVMTWNGWMEAHTRRPAATVVGRHLFEVYPDLVTRELDRCYRDALDGRVSTLSQGLHRYVLGLPPTHPDLRLSEMPQSGRIEPLLDGETVIGTVTTIENVSERLANEAELRKQIEAQQVARAAAEAALKSKDEFLSILSHELRQPLNAVLGWTRILLARNEPDPNLTARALQVIDRNATAQAAMIDDILDVARIAAGKLRLEMQPTDLTHVVLAAIDASLPAAEAKGITLRANVDEDGLLVLGDPTRLQQIIWNLLSNAVKFTEPHGSIQVSLGAIGSIVRLTVDDTGCGISPEFLPFVFDRFRQSDASSSRRQGGLGLGLALVRDLVGLHGGAIRAASPGAHRGATFTIDLPATSVERRWSQSRREPALRRTPSLAGIRALVVDDETDSRELLVTALTRCGADVVAASSSEEALHLLREAGVGRQLDIIVSDIGMPKDDGFELMRRVRELPASEGGAIPAVAVTAYSTPDDRMLALSAGFQLHVSKPIDPLAVASAVERVLRGAKSSTSSTSSAS